jgi:hypothetical protein
LWNVNLLGVGECFATAAIGYVTIFTIHSVATHPIFLIPL